MFNKLKTKVASVLVGLALVLAGLAAGLLTPKAVLLKGTIGLDAVHATSSQLELLAATVQTLVATSTGCSSRQISTVGHAIMLTFSERTNDLPTATNGHLQLASTTTLYPAEEVGCGKVKAISATGAGTIIRITEYR